MTMCFTKQCGPCSCWKLRVRWCEQCQQWICRMVFRSHGCQVNDPYYRFGVLIEHDQRVMIANENSEGVR
jgi:hypothetical protein